MAKSSLQNLKLGIFVVLGTLLLLFAAYLLGNRQNMFTRNIQIGAVFKNAKGLQNGNDVRYSGISVGTVNRIEMINDSSIYIGMIVKEKMRDHIKKDAIAMIGSDGLVGSMLINIVPGEGITSPVMEGDTLQAYSQMATQDMLNTLSVTNENAALLTADLLKVTQALVSGDGVLGRLLNDTLMANELQAGISDLKLASGRASATLSELQGMIRDINMDENMAGVFLKDSVTATQIRLLMSNLDSTGQNVKVLSMNLRATLDDLNKDEGVVSYLAKDTLLAATLEQTMQNLESGTGRFNENMEALKHNFLTRRYFKKQEREKRRAARKNKQE